MSKRLASIALFLMTSACAAFLAPGIAATCVAPTPMFHGFDSYFACPDSGAHGAFSYQANAPFVTNTGSLEAKRTTLNPNWAAVVVQLLFDAGVERGGTIAIGVSGSFPALNLAAFSAAFEGRRSGGRAGKLMLDPWRE